jgi:kynureninase
MSMPEVTAAEDVFAATRERFLIPDGVHYFDGNSLGLLPRIVQQHAYHVITDEWGHGLIRSWHDAQWRTLPERVGAKIAALIGASADEVIACDSTSVNLFKVLVSAVRIQADRRTIVTDGDAFPTDLYIVDQVASLFGMKVVAVPAKQIPDALDDDTAAVVLTHVDYRSAEIYDMPAFTAAAHRAGALVIWDLSHTAGGVPCDLNGCSADFAVGCGYKYLNGGPGAPGYLFVAKRHVQACDQPLSGWFGHAVPFDFVPGYVPAQSTRRFLCGTNPVLGLSALSRALDVFEGVSLEALRERSILLTQTFIEQVDERLLEYGFVVASPRMAKRRGSHVSLRHPEGYSVMQALAARRFIGDFRMPDYMRFGFAPLYNTEAEVQALVNAIEEIMRTEAWRDAAYQQRRDFT